MGAVEVTETGVVVDAALLARAFKLEEAAIKARMRDGRITSVSERGEGADAGRSRVTFYHAGRALRLTLDAQGEILGKATFPAR
ncbi:DUF6522 family protein [Pararhodobacter oceanensis]|uniref:DUF6522 family protein n=1 Tax=Pararhodobacter oceanensis TaxID=2172121 RepID=UPI003A95B2D7